jgi:N-acetylglucosamine malate deacetylase 2
MSSVTLARLTGGRRVRSALAVVAHPDDESFGLGGVLRWLAGLDVETRVLCLTHGEASTLGHAEDLAATRSAELACAAAALGVSHVRLLDLPDGSLAGVADNDVDPVVEANLGSSDLVIVFEPGGVTGHPDHRAATAAAERVALKHGLPVIEWGVSGEVAEALNAEFGTAFTGIAGADIVVDRADQWCAIECHDSQLGGNAVVVRRLALQEERDRVRGVRADGSDVDVAAAEMDVIEATAD